MTAPLSILLLLLLPFSSTSSSANPRHPPHYPTTAPLQYPTTAPLQWPRPTDHDLEAAKDDVVRFAASKLPLFSGPGRPATLAAMFNRTFTFTATHTLSRFPGDGTAYVDTGDIRQQWLRDSCNQLRAYLPVVPTSPSVGRLFAQALRRMVRFFNGDPYASAFNFNASDPSQHVECPRTLACRNCSCSDCAPACSLFSFQHDWEMDSISFVVDLAHRFWQVTQTGTNSTNGTYGVFDAAFHLALRNMVRVMQVEQDHTNMSPYRYRRSDSDAGANTFPPNATAKVGLLWGNSRPSDDRDYYNYNIPQNMLAVVALGKAAEIASRVYGDSVLAAAAVGLGDSVDEAIQQYGVFPGNASVPRM